MVAGVNELECEKVYKLRYNNKVRLVVALEDNYDNYLCWDFTANQYRTLAHNRIDFNSVEDVTEKAIIRDGDQRERFGHRDVRSCYHDGRTYTVRF